MAKKATPAKAEKKVKKVRPAIEFAPLKFKEFTITQKRSGRYEVMGAKGNLNGLEKAKLLQEAKVLKGSFKKAAAAEAPTA